MATLSKVGIITMGKTRVAAGKPHLERRMEMVNRTWRPQENDKQPRRLLFSIQNKKKPRIAGQKAEASCPLESHNLLHHF